MHILHTRVVIKITLQLKKRQHNKSSSHNNKSKCKIKHGVIAAEMRMMKEEVDLKESVTKKKTYNQLKLGVAAAVVVAAAAAAAVAAAAGTSRPRDARWRA